MSECVIPAGYRFTTTSYEGDGDNSKTIVLEGVSEEKARLLAGILDVLATRGSGLENAYCPSEAQRDKAHKLLLPLFEKYAGAFKLEEMTMEDIRGDVGRIQDYIANNLLGYPASEGIALRVLTDVKIEHIPRDILIEDATDRMLNREGNASGSAVRER